MCCARSIVCVFYRILLPTYLHQALDGDIEHSIFDCGLLTKKKMWKELNVELIW